MELPKKGIWGPPTIRRRMGRPRYRFKDGITKRPEGTECEQMVGIGTRPKEMAYFDVGG